MKQLIAREFLYFFTALVVAIPTSILFLYLMDLKPAGAEMTADERVLEKEFLIVGAILGFVGVYLVRLTVWSAQKVLPEEAKIEILI